MSITVKELWSKTYNSNGKPDWSHIYPYYHPDMVFQDSVQRIEGMEEFMALCERLAKRCESLQMEILSIAQDSNFILMDWIMTMSFNKYPSTPVYGSTKLTLHPTAGSFTSATILTCGAIFSTGSHISKKPIGILCENTSGRGKPMVKRKLPDELIFIENRRAIQHTTTASMAGKVCVVSGSTSGVGLEAVKRLARGGAHIVMVCRNPDKAEAIRKEIDDTIQCSVDIITADFSVLERCPQSG